MNEYEEIKRKIEGKNKKNIFLSFFEIIFVICILFLSFLIYAKNDENGLMLQKYFNLNVSFKEFNNKIGLTLSKMFSNLNIFDEEEKKDKMVSQSVYYQSVGDNYYTYETHEVVMLNYGKILNIKNENNFYVVNVYYSSGINACYYELNDVNVKKGDLLNKRESIGTYEEKFKVIFAKNNQIITYEEVLLS